MKKILLGATALCGVVFADAPVMPTVTDVEAKYTNNVNPQATNNFQQSIDVGFANTTGNTKTTNLNARYGATYTTLGWRNQALKWAFDASMFLTRDNDATTNEEYVAMLGAQQDIADGWYGYGAINWLQNEFRNYDNKWSFGAGVGKVLFDDGKHSLSAKFGGAYNIEDYANAQEDEKFWSLNQYLEYNNKLTTTSNLYVKLGAMENLDNFSKDYEMLGVVGVDVALGEALYLKVEQEVAYDALPPIGFDKTDTKTIVSLGYKF